MCNPKIIEKTLCILLENQNNTKHIDDWVQLVNSHLPSRDMFTKSEFSQLIGVFGRSGKIVLVKRRIRKNTQYEFVENGQDKVFQ